MKRTLSVWLLVTIAAASSPSQAPRTHRLEATPETVAYGYYWSEAKPVLKIASGDIIDVDTLLTNSPTGLARAGVPDDQIQASLKAIVAAFPQGNPGRGPGGHILTGPVYVEGAEPGDALEVKVLSIDLPIDYGYNGCAWRRRQRSDASAAIRRGDTPVISITKSSPRARRFTFLSSCRAHCSKSATVTPHKATVK
jgi:hypothetical protein